MKKFKFNFFTVEMPDGCEYVVTYVSLSRKKVAEELRIPLEKVRNGADSRGTDISKYFEKHPRATP